MSNNCLTGIGNAHKQSYRRLGIRPQSTRAVIYYSLDVFHQAISRSKFTLSSIRFCYSSEGSFTKDISAWYEFKNYNFKIASASPRGQWVKSHITAWDGLVSITCSIATHDCVVNQNTKQYAVSHELYQLFDIVIFRSGLAWKWYI